MPNPGAHLELNTDDLNRARKFYGSLFKWKVAAYPGSPDYLGINLGKTATSGAMQQKPMPEAPTAWLPYVEVDDVKKTIAKAKKLGATIVLDFQDIGDMGAIGVFIDPQGASLGVWGKAVKRKKSRR